MDLGSECSALESEGDNEGNRENTPRVDENGYENNDSFANEDPGLTPDQKGTDKNETSVVGSATKKGLGLKRWKRIIRRDVVKDPNLCVDHSKILKRGLSGGGGGSNLTKNIEDSVSVGSLNVFGNVVISDGYEIGDSGSDSRYAHGSTFSFGNDSENSEDRSSKSSTAASSPKLRHVREKSRNKNVNWKKLTNKAQQGKGQGESSKKPRNVRVKREKDNSHSSIDSDSRSSNFKQGIFTVNNNGKHSDEAHTNEHFPQDFRDGYCNENMREDEDLGLENLAANLSWEDKEEEREPSQSSTVKDPLIESICSLQAAQEALEQEIKKFGEIGNEPLSPDDDSTKCSSAATNINAVDLGFYKLCLSGQYGVEGNKQTASNSLELQILSLTENVNILESKSEELQTVLTVKDSRIAELETALNGCNFPKEEYACTIALSEKKLKEVESELESLFMQKIEAEVEYLAIRKMMLSLKVTSAFTLLEKQEMLSGNQVQDPNNLGEPDSKDSMMKNKADELEKYCGDILGVEETFMMQKRVCKLTFCLSLQLMLLILVFWFFVSHLSPNSGVVAPT